MKVLSKSVRITLLFDFCVLLLSSIYWFSYCKLDAKFQIITVMLVVLTGLVTLALKSNYIIREFNNTKKNLYLLFEGVVFAHIPILVLFLLFNRDINAFKFILFNLLTVFVLLKVYRMIFHFYLFNIKKHKNILILGVDENARLICNEIENKKALMMNVSAFLADNEFSCIDYSKYKVYPQGSNIGEIINKHKNDEGVNPHHLNPEYLKMTEAEAMTVRKFIPGVETSFDLVETWCDNYDDSNK